jgi:hypothetical protein
MIDTDKQPQVETSPEVVPPEDNISAWMDFMAPKDDSAPIELFEPEEPKVETVPVEPAPQQAEVKATPQAEPTAPSEIDLLRGQLDEMQKLVTHLTAQKPAQTWVNTDSKDAGKTQTSDELPSYQFQIQPQLVADLGSEDDSTRARALSAFVASIGRAVHQEVRADVLKRVSLMFDGRDSELEARRVQDSYRQDYYTAFPQHNKTEVVPLVAAVTQMVVAETGAKTWSKELRDSIGARVNALLRAGQGAASQGLATSPKPPAFTGTKRSGPRGEASPSAVELDIERTFSLG